MGGVELLLQLGDLSPETGQLSPSRVLRLPSAFDGGQPPKRSGVALFAPLSDQRRIQVFPAENLADSPRPAGQLGLVDLLETIPTDLVELWR